MTSLALLIVALARAAPPHGAANTVAFGSARFSVYTPSVIRLEWSKNKTFDDAPSMTVVNRSPPTPAFTKAVSADGSTLTLKTTRVTLVYSRSGGDGDIGRADCATLNVSIPAVDGGGGTTTWCPSMGMAPASQRNLNGSLETGDCYVGWADCIDVYDQKMQPGVISRAVRTMMLLLLLLTCSCWCSCCCCCRWCSCCSY